MKQEWIDTCLRLVTKPADFFSGSRKILRGRSFTFEDVQSDMVMLDCGFTEAKMKMLKRLYYHEASHTAALDLWKGRVEKRKYGSVGFSCYNHFVKQAADTGLKGSVMGPCIQSVTLTYMPDHSVAIDAFYRTTELFKKFPADLVFMQDILLPPFELPRISSMQFHFANITLHPMYFVVVMPHLDDPIEILEKLRKVDHRYWVMIVKATSRYVLEEHYRGIANFAQARRVQMDAMARITGRKLKQLQKYLRDNHPGFDRAYKGDDDGDND